MKLLMPVNALHAVCMNAVDTINSTFFSLFACKSASFSPIHQTFSDKKLPHLDVEQGRELKKDYSIKSII
jgi:hypothetical protein